MKGSITKNKKKNIINQEGQPLFNYEYCVKWRIVIENNSCTEGGLLDEPQMLGMLTQRD